jgi:hypothetical protein
LARHGSSTPQHFCLPRHARGRQGGRARSVQEYLPTHWQSTRCHHFSKGKVSLSQNGSKNIMQNKNITTTKTKLFEYQCQDPDCLKWTRIILPIDECGDPLRAARCSGCSKPLGHDYCPNPECKTYHPIYNDLSQSTYCPLCATTLVHGVRAVEENQALNGWRGLTGVLVGMTCLQILTIQHPHATQQALHMFFLIPNRIDAFLKPYHIETSVAVLAMAFWAYFSMGNNLPSKYLASLWTLLTGKRSDSWECRRDGITSDWFRVSLIFGMRQERASTREAMRIRRRLQIIKRAGLRRLFFKTKTASL